MNFKKTSLIVMVTIFLLSMTSVFAFDTELKTYIETNGTYNGGRISGIDSSISNKLSYSDNGGENVILNVGGHEVSVYVTAEDQQAMLDAMANREAAKQQASDVTTRVQDVTDGLNLGADVDTANRLLSGFMPILSTLLGVMCVLITVGMTVFSGFDICYICFPVFQEKCENAKASGTGGMARKNPGKNGNKLRFVSLDAQRAVELSNTDNAGSNPLIIYGKSRILSYIVLAILLFMLLTGNISLITDLALRVVSGIMDVLTGVQ